MILIWTGRGVLIFLIFIVMAVIAMTLTVTQIAEPAGLTDNQGVNLTIAIAAFLSALATYPLDRLIMKQQADQTLVDPKTGQAYVFRNRDSLCCIETRYWTYIFAIIAITMLMLTFLL